MTGRSLIFVFAALLISGCVANPNPDEPAPRVEETYKSQPTIASTPTPVPSVEASQDPDQIEDPTDAFGELACSCTQKKDCNCSPAKDSGKTEAPAEMVCRDAPKSMMKYLQTIFSLNPDRAKFIDGKMIHTGGNRWEVAVNTWVNPNDKVQSLHKFAPVEYFALEIKWGHPDAPVKYQKASNWRLGVSAKKCLKP